MKKPRPSRPPKSVPLTIREVALTAYGVERPAIVLAASEFRERCLQLMDQVQRERTEVIITKHDKPIAKLVPVEVASRVDYFGALKHLGPVTWKVNPEQIPADTEWEDAWEQRWREVLRQRRRRPR
jgi:prevent-host-death family protein